MWDAAFRTNCITSMLYLCSPFSISCTLITAFPRHTNSPSCTFGRVQIQSHRVARIIRGRSTGSRCAYRSQREKENVYIHRRRYHGTEQRIWHFHHNGKYSRVPLLDFCSWMSFAIVKFTSNTDDIFIFSCRIRATLVVKSYVSFINKIHVDYQRT